VRWAKVSLAAHFRASLITPVALLGALVGDEPVRTTSEHHGEQARQ